MFLEKTATLNQLESFPQVRYKSKLIGYAVTKVVFRGYYASEKLQVIYFIYYKLILKIDNLIN